MQKSKTYLQLLFCAIFLSSSSFVFANENLPAATVPTAQVTDKPTTPPNSSVQENTVATSPIAEKVEQTEKVEKIELPVANNTTPVTSASEPATDAKPSVIIGDKVNINTANAIELQRVLLGIGAKKAEAIIQYREKNGAFTTLEQLLNVQGFGKMTLEKNLDRIIL